MDPITVAIVGCGSRGHDTYAQCQKRFPDRMKIVAAADIDAEKLERMRREFSLPDDMCFTSAEALLEQPRLADILFICTPDDMHYTEAMAALALDYHLLLEKPLARAPQECRDIERLAIERHRHVVVCHVLRYTVFYQKLKELIDNGTIGDVVNIQALEKVCYWHQAHSFVRGNWRCAEETNPMILAKSCHDMDILLWLAGKHCERVSSFGTLKHFRPDNAPEGAPARCTDGCPAAATCPYNAEAFYMGHVANGMLDWPVNVLSPYPSEKTIRKAIEEGPYGRCVYHCDNDVVDHQVVNLLLEDGVTVDFNMSAFTAHQGRNIRIMGSMGELLGDMDANSIRVMRFGQPDEEIDVRTLTDDFSGHGGGDVRMVEDLLGLVAGEREITGALTNISDSVESHLVALAAEASRLQGGAAISMKD